MSLRIISDFLFIIIDLVSRGQHRDLSISGGHPAKEPYHWGGTSPGEDFGMRAIRPYHWGGSRVPGTGFQVRFLPPMVWVPIASENLTVRKGKIDERMGREAFSRVIDGHGHQNRQHYENENSEIAPLHIHFETNPP